MQEKKFYSKTDRETDESLLPGQEGRPVKCSKCGGGLQYRSHGEYLCKACGNIEYDDFGKIRQYLDENGASPVAAISEYTGVPFSRINQFLRQGRLQVSGDSRKKPDFL